MIGPREVVAHDQAFKFKTLNLFHWLTIYIYPYVTWFHEPNKVSLRDLPGFKDVFHLSYEQTSKGVPSIARCCSNPAVLI